MTNSEVRLDVDPPFLVADFAKSLPKSNWGAFIAGYAAFLFSSLALLSTIVLILGGTGLPFESNVELIDPVYGYAALGFAVVGLAFALVWAKRSDYIEWL